MISYQILQTNITRIVWQTGRRIISEIMGVKGLTSYWLMRKKTPSELHNWTRNSSSVVPTICGALKKDPTLEKDNLQHIFKHSLAILQYLLTGHHKLGCRIVLCYHNTMIFHVL